LVERYYSDACCSGDREYYRIESVDAPAQLTLDANRAWVGEDALSRCRAMRRLLTATAAVVALLGGPAMAQWGGGDGSQAGATAWCAARAAGKSPDQASWAASNALVNSMGGGFASNIATIITGGRTMRDSLEYLIKKQCPEYLYSVQSTNPSATNDYKNDLNSYWTAENCSKYPDVGKESCGLTAKTTPATSTTSCNKVIEKYECSYKKYLSANPSVESWAKANPAMAKKEAIRLSAIDAEEIALPAVKEANAKIEAQPSPKDIENKCLKAADYKGCMEYNLKK
jgi:hypothetical protein